MTGWKDVKNGADPARWSEPDPEGWIRTGESAFPGKEKGRGPKPSPLDSLNPER